MSSNDFCRMTAYPEITPKMEFCPDCRRYVLMAAGLPIFLFLRATLEDRPERFAFLGVRFEECGLRQHSYHPLLNHPRLGLLNLQHVAENDHGLGTNYQRERSA